MPLSFLTPMRRASLLGALIVLLCSASMWFYVQKVLIPYERNDAAAHQRPRGNLSDLYPRWLGARELLQHGRNPYDDDLTLAIQQGYYGRVLDPSRPDDPKDQQGFAYPVYVVFLLAPLIAFPFHGVHLFFYWLLVGVTAASVWLWLRALSWRLSWWGVASIMVLTLGTFPAVQGIKLQQLSLLVAAIMAGSVACVASGFLFLGGALLALATIKPQLAWPLVGWLLVWAVSEWRARRNFVFGFASVMALLLGGAELILPGWLRMFVAAISKYHRYTQNQSVLDQLVPWAFGGKILAAIAVLGCVFLAWGLRREPAGGEAFGAVAALVMALTVLVVPMFAPYNQVLLLPAVLLLARERRRIVSRSGLVRFGFVVGGFSVAWQWIASLILSAAFVLISPAWALDRWKWPFFATFAIPVIIFALTFVAVSARNSEARR